MAVQQNKKSPSRRDMRRSRYKLSSPTLSTDPQTGDRHRRHHISAGGFYRGKQIIEPKVSPAATEDEDDNE